MGPGIYQPSPAQVSNSARMHTTKPNRTDPAQAASIPAQSNPDSKQTDREKPSQTSMTSPTSIQTRPEQSSQHYRPESTSLPSPQPNPATHTHAATKKSAARAKHRWNSEEHVTRPTPPRIETIPSTYSSTTTPNFPAQPRPALRTNQIRPSQQTWLSERLLISKEYGRIGKFG
jgi:hypothetical protein